MPTFAQSAVSLHKDRFTITVMGTESSVDCLNLANFLYFFRAAYTAFLLAENDPATARHLRKAVEDGDREQLSKLLRATLVSHPDILQLRVPTGVADLTFTQISMNSPIKFLGYTVAGCVLALTSATIVAGGKANMTKLEFEVQPIGPAIGELIKHFPNYEDQHLGWDRTDPNKKIQPPSGERPLPRPLEGEKAVRKPPKPKK